MTDEHDDSRVHPQVVIDLTVGPVSVTVKAHAPLDQVAATAGDLLDRAGRVDPPRGPAVGFAAGGGVHLETPITYPAEPHG